MRLLRNRPGAGHTEVDEMTQLPGPFGQHPGQPSGWPPPPPTGTPYGTGSWGSGLPDPQPAGPPSRDGAGPARRGPGWGALVVAMVLTALLTGAGVWAAMLATDGGGAEPAPSSRAVDREPPAASAEPGTAIDWTAVADAVRPSVVTIQLQGPQGAGQGSGVIIDADGSILTNNHVVAPAAGGSAIRVVLQDGRVFSDVDVVGLDPSTDLAVVRIEDPPADLEPATLGDSSAVVPGQPVMALGNPLGLSDTVTTGIVSAVDRPVTTQNQGTGDPFGGSNEPVVTNAIQTDAPINPGNSGGALVDANGSVVGINSSIATTGGASGQAGSIGLGFAIPINEAERIANELRATGKATHAVLGVMLQDGLTKAPDGDRLAAVVAEVVDGSPAAEAGLRSGDAVVAVDGEAVSSAESLTAQVRERAPGTAVTVTVLRDGASVDVEVTLGTRPSD